ncbi:flavodoxin family protein [Pseudomonas sp. CFSAN084952]|uniref:NAD(P)H-dependent oxidoreductase n=1 Tax=Pseudomonas TaxID=286 RepID=UPI00129987DF|nr:NAD(P)H-dependent oxidoreductase [Pseudomonas sp. CFSAN084952]QGF92997.1 flavodoxin family protein [Pseudomonas sp. CFSAN084952]QUW65120.1 NAD(P)H-dependent oxidoreductase [Pseudomonas synxantha]
MKVFVVYAHPEPKSFCAALKSAAVQEFQAARHDVLVSDLYEMGFNPIASAEDFLQPERPDYCAYALEQRNAVRTGSLRTDIQEELDKLLWCDLLVLIFPLFWCSTPAILKGWIDRVFVSGKVYGGKRFYNHGGLHGKRVLVSVTLGGQEHMFQPEGIHGSLRDMLKPLLQGTLAYSGMNVHEPFVGWHVPYVSTGQRLLLLEQWQDRIRKLDDESLLVFPCLEDFTETLYPMP